MTTTVTNVSTQRQQVQLIRAVIEEYYVEQAASAQLLINRDRKRTISLSLPNSNGTLPINQYTDILTSLFILLSFHVLLHGE